MAKKTKKAKKTKNRKVTKQRKRWFRGFSTAVREYPSCRWWRNGTLMKYKTICSMQACIDGGDIELDGPPPNGKPIRSKE